MLIQTKKIVKSDTQQAREYVSSLSDEVKDQVYCEVIEMHSSLSNELEKGVSLDRIDKHTYSLNSYFENQKKYNKKSALFERLDDLLIQKCYVFNLFQ
jgi:hypothetical protein